MNSNYSPNGPAPNEEALPDLPLIPSLKEEQIILSESERIMNSENINNTMETVTEEILNSLLPSSAINQVAGGKRRRKTYKKSRKYRKATLRRRR